MGVINLDYYTVGGGEYIDFALRAIGILLGDSAFGTLVRVTFLWGVIWAIVMSVFGWQYRTLFIRHMAITFFALHLFFMPVVNLNITDTKTGQVFSHQNVPFVPGFAMSFFSNLSRYLTKFFESVGHQGVIVTWSSATGSVPVQLDYSKTGFAGMFDYYNAMLKVDPTMAATKFEAFDMLRAYLAQCFIPYTSALSANEIRNILRSTDLITSIRIDASLLMTYRDNIYTCTDFYNNLLVPRWNDMISDISIDPISIGIPPYQVLTVTSAINALTGASHRFSTIVSQAGIINSMKYVFTTYTFGDGDTDLLARYAGARTEEQAKALGKAFGVWVKENLPILKNFLEAFIIFLLPITGLVMLMPFPGAKLILGYLYFTAWVYLWDPILAILDIFVKMSAIAQAQAWLNSHGVSGLSLITYGYIMDQAQWFPAIAGYIGLSAPMFAWAVLKGFEVSVYGLSHMIGSMGAHMLGQEVNPQRLSQLVHEERMAREAGFMNAGEASWFASGYAAARTTSQGWWNRALGQDMLGAMIGGMSHSLGRGLATFNTHRGADNFARAMLDSGALGAPALNYVDPGTGLLTRVYADTRGNVAKLSAESGFESIWRLEGVKQYLSEKLHKYEKELKDLKGQYENVMKNIVAEASEGRGLATVFRDSQSFWKAYEESRASSIRTMAEHHESLVKQLASIEGLERRDAEELATQLLFSLAQGNDIKSIKGKIMEFLKIKTGMKGQALSTVVDKIVESTAFKEAKEFAQGDNFRQALEDLITYTEKHASNESWSREKGITDEERVRLLESLNKAVQYARAKQEMESYVNMYSKRLSFLSNLRENLDHMFVMWYARKTGVDFYTAAKTLNNLYFNRDPQFNNLVEQFFAETIDEDRSRIDSVIEHKGNELIKSVAGTAETVDKIVTNGREVVENSYARMKQELERKDDVSGVVKQQLQKGEDLKTSVVNTREDIQKAITANAQAIRKEGEGIGPDRELKEKQKMLHEAHNNPLNMVMHMVSEGPGHKVIMGSAFAPVALEAGAKALETLGKRWSGGGGPPYGRFNWIGGLVEGVGTVLRMPVASAGGVAGTLAFAPLVALGAYTATRFVMENVHIGGKSLDDLFYENVTEPTLDWIGRTTGWWEPVNRNR